MANKPSAMHQFYTYETLTWYAKRNSREKINNLFCTVITGFPAGVNSIMDRSIGDISNLLRGHLSSG